MPGRSSRRRGTRVPRSIASKPVRLVVGYNLAPTATAGGVLAGSIPASSFTSAPDWASLAAVFQTVRVAYMHVMVFDQAAFTQQGGGYMAIYNSQTAPTASINSIIELPSFRLYKAGGQDRPYTMTWRMNLPEDKLFDPVASTVARGGFVYYFLGLAASSIQTTFVVKFGLDLTQS